MQAGWQSREGSCRKGKASQAGRAVCTGFWRALEASEDATASSQVAAAASTGTDAVTIPARVRVMPALTEGPAQRDRSVLHRVGLR